MADAWTQWLAQQRQPQAAQPQSTNALSRLFGSLFPTTGGGAGPGQVPTPKMGMYTPGLALQPAGPSTPIDYTRMRALLNSGVLKNGGHVNDPGPTPEGPAAPAPAAAPQGKPDFNLFAMLGRMGEARKNGDQAGADQILRDFMSNLIPR